MNHDPTYKLSSKESSEELSKEDKLKFIEYLIQIKPKLLVISGGEPLLEPCIFEYLEKAARGGLFVSLFTNATLLNKKNIKKLKKVGVQEVVVSLESSKSKIHNNLRRHFNCIIRNIKEARKQKLPIYLSLTLMKKNSLEISSYFQFAEKLEIKGIFFKRLFPFNQRDRKEILPPQKYKEVLSEIKKEEGCRKKLMVYIGDPLECLIGTNKNIKFFGCSGGYSKICVSPEGDIFPCPYFRLKVGNIKEKNLLRTLMTSELLKEITHRKNLKGRCANCKYKLDCGGCRAMGFLLNKDWKSEDIMCWYGEKDS